LLLINDLSRFDYLHDFVVEHFEFFDLENLDNKLPFLIFIYNLLFICQNNISLLGLL
jgi:hypothetical protein